MRTPRVQAPLSALRSFEAAARLRSISEAAAELGVTPSAVSVQVRRLEETVGRPLFVRGHRSVALSETGAKLAPKLSEIFSELEILLSATVRTQAAALRISAMPSFAAKWLAPRLARFTALHPQYPVRVAGEDALVAFDRLEADVGLRYGLGQYPGLYSELISQAEAYPVCSPAFAAEHAQELATPGGLARLPLLHDEIAERAPDLPSWAAWFADAGVDYQAGSRGPQFESHHMALTAAVSGQGVALGLTPIVDDDVKSGRLVRLFDTAVPSAFAFWLVCRPDQVKARKVAAFRSWIALEIGDAARSRSD